MWTRFVSALEHRPPPSEPSARQAVDPALAVLAEELAAGVRPPVTSPLRHPLPKRVATAFVLALVSLPHFAATLLHPERAGTVDPGEPPRRAPDAALAVSTESIERALGVSAWEIDELREEVDRRAGRALKQTRALHWLWSSFGLPGGARTLVRVLFPATGEATTELVRRGGQLTILVQGRPSPRVSSYLPWLAPEPLEPWFGAGVDRALRARIGRGIGASEDEVADLLDGMVTRVPAAAPAPFLRLDQWRSHGYAALTDLGARYTEGQALVRPIPPDGARWRDWIGVDPDGNLVLEEPAEHVFDDLAIARVQDMVRLVYAAILASVDVASDGSEAGVAVADLDLYDAPRHLHAVIDPLVTWAGRTATHKHVAAELERPYQEVAALLEGVREKWVAHAAARWTAPPSEGRPSVQTLLVGHLVGLHVSLRRLARQPPDPRAPHRDLLLLFAAHYLREARLERLWIRALSDDTEPETADDVPARWFWPAWIRLLDTIQSETP